MVPKAYGDLKMRTASFLSSYRACQDCKFAIDRFKNEQFSFSQWKIGWAGICALLNTSVHLMKNKDAKSCIPEPIKLGLVQKWHEIGKDRDRYQIYWEFIRKERNDILKEYEFSVYEVILRSDGYESLFKPARSMLGLLEENETEALVIRGGPYNGRLAIEIANQGVIWVQETIFEVLKSAGYDPEEEVKFRDFLSS